MSAAELAALVTAIGGVIALIMHVKNPAAHSGTNATARKP